MHHFNNPGDGAPSQNPPRINDQFQGQSFHQPPPDLYAMGREEGSKSQKIAGNSSSQSYVQKMQWIAGALLMYTGAHNGLNAWHRAGENWFWFCFIILGVLSMEWFLHNGHHAWLKGEFTRKQTRIFKLWGSLFFFFIVLGVLTGAQVADGLANQFIDFHYHWILPVGTVLLLPALYHLNSANEITQAKNAGAKPENISSSREGEGEA